MGVMRGTLIGVVLACSAIVTAARPSPAPTADARVTIDAGPIVGSASDHMAVFKGIPYAKPPVGDLRWRPPQPPDRWTDPRDATRFGAACPQTDPGDTVDGGRAVTNEDCLTLNVWAPAHVTSPAPVMVWLHGGGNTQGAGFRRYYDGAAFARDGVVLVTINYRLGLFGFFAHPALTTEAPAGAPLANFVLMDQLASLRWVKTNIGAFGGDPANVTLFGESAGGSDALDLMALPASAGLFQRAIVESAGFFAHSVTLADAEAIGIKLAAAARLGPSASAADLRAVPESDVLRRTDDADGPVVDGRLMKEAPVASVASGRFPHVPLMIGTNSDEGSLRGDSVAGADVLSRFTTDEIASVRAAYGGTIDDNALARALFRDEYFAAPARWVAGRASTGAPTFLYRFSYVRRSQRGRAAGAGHGAEIPYVFDSWSQSPSGGSLLPLDDRAEAARIHGCWIAFAKTGTPACEGVPAWPLYSPSRDELMNFDVTPVVAKTPDREVLTILEPRFVNPNRRAGGLDRVGPAR
jgi:para-nitrobenzyl esterase